MFGGLIALAACGEDRGDTTGPGLTTPGFRFVYVDPTGESITLRGDSAAWAEDGTSFYANLYSLAAPPSVSGPLHINFGVVWPSSRPPLDPATYRFPDAGASETAVLTVSAFQFVLAADSILLTITRVDSMVLEGTVAAVLTQYLPPPGGQRHLLTGRFLLRRDGL